MPWLQVNTPKRWPWGQILALSKIHGHCLSPACSDSLRKEGWLLGYLRTNFLTACAVSFHRANCAHRSWIDFFCLSACFCVCVCVCVDDNDVLVCCPLSMFSSIYTFQDWLSVTYYSRLLSQVLICSKFSGNCNQRFGETTLRISSLIQF